MSAHRKLRVHVENDPRAEAALRLTPERFDAALADRTGLRERLSVSFNQEPEAFAATAGDAEIIFAGRKIATLDAVPGLRWVQSVSAGVEGMLPYLPADVVLTNASGVHGDKAAEFVLASVLMLQYRIPQFVADQRQRLWRPEFCGTVKGRTATLLGVGAIGAASAEKLKLMGLRTQGISRRGGPRDHIDVSVGFEELDSVLPQTDVLISSAPLTAETAGLIDRRRLDLLPQHAGVVIVGRAGVFDCTALVAKLRDGTLGGAVLDVFPVEPLPPEHEIWAAPNLLMTPHCSVDDHEVYLDRCLDIFVDNLARFADGQPLRNQVDPSLGY